MNSDVRKKIDPVRKALLKDTDWTQLTDSPLSEEEKTAWAAYRQAIRDIPQNQTPESEIEVIWPDKPE